MARKNEIIKCDLSGKEISRYNSAREASMMEGISEDKIYKVLSGKQKTADGWVFIKTGNSCNAVDKIGNGKYKCPYCERHFDTYNGLCKHVIREKAHGQISKEQLLTDFKYDGVRPTCKCGCGEYTSIDPNGEAHFCDYVFGHAIRVHNNWGHNILAQEKSAETRRRQYAEGSRMQWNKGKKWEETYNIDQIKKLHNEIHTEERGKKIQMRLSGVPKSEEHKQKLRETFNTEKYKTILSERMNHRLKNESFSISSKGETDFINEFIEPLGLEYEKQYYLKEIHQYSDIYIPSKNLIIEYDGDFWHCNPNKYPEGPKYVYQTKHIEKDKIKNEYCSNNGINILRIWESDAKNNKNHVRDKIKKAINR